MAALEKKRIELTPLLLADMHSNAMKIEIPKSDILGLNNRLVKLQKILTGKYVISTGDLLDCYPLIYHYFNLTTLPKSTLRACATYLAFLVPSWNPSVRLVQWADLIIKDNQLITSSGVHSLSLYELAEANRERGKLVIQLGFRKIGSSLGEQQSLLAAHCKFSQELVQVAIRYKGRVKRGDLNSTDLFAVSILLMLRQICPLA